ncbi:MAG: OmpA family protein [Bryobacterales bacterium]|nr:OmpA family protein [Bryobacterales bacterium]
MDPNQQPIIIKKKKGGHGGHHGGAWKVAYADFVTAMMALFIVLWLLSSDEKVKQAVGGYFSDPTGNGKLMGSTLAGSGDGLQLNKDDMSQLKEKIEAALKQAPEFRKMSKNIQITVTGEGLRIELLEDEKGMFFQSGSPDPSDMGVELVSKLAEELGKLPNKLFLEGHTDAKPFASVNGYSNWELSSDRANAARRIMMEHGVRPDQVAQVRGFADQRLRVTGEPDHASNRRVSVIVQYLEPPKPAPGEEPKEEAGGGHGEAKADGHGEKKAEAHGEAKDAGHGAKPAEAGKKH